MKKETITRLIISAIFTALIFILAFTPLGFFKTGGLSVSLLTIPVTIGAILLGPVHGAFLGAIFGMTSLIQCFGLEPFGTTLMGINPIYAIIVCLVPRILMGYLTGLVFRAFKKGKLTRIGAAITSVCAPLLNTVLFMTALILCFYNTDVIQGIVTTLGAGNVFTFAILFVGINGALEVAAGLILSFPISAALYSYVSKRKIV